MSRVGTDTSLLPVLLMELTSNPSYEKSGNNEHTRNLKEASRGLNRTPLKTLLKHWPNGLASRRKFWTCI